MGIAKFMESITLSLEECVHTHQKLKVLCWVAVALISVIVVIGVSVPIILLHLKEIGV